MQRDRLGGRVQPGVEVVRHGIKHPADKAGVYADLVRLRSGMYALRDWTGCARTVPQAWAREQAAVV